eukprot:CAMPEP_0114600436 /NCGR_PEP_ID=MMETSP0125-20121206/23025_1 /TAXON_ID=485358 ORGANISM="Aristerostoma sp., Strain ATCC 50986" /NCGR_SAMPLE_ID=MMETSP0125 /ASSEMBLY_ACC=CAM_ASM_000245 /LENGTH=63 /DNA_ID=CAMNT_0001808603 /DNA_START=429 /DNA_END=616 /DNA_ORIENTATION=+
MYKSLQAILDCDNVDDLYITWTYETNIMGKHVIKELIPNGNEIFVTNKNRKAYSKRFAEAFMT